MKNLTKKDLAIIAHCNESAAAMVCVLGTAGDGRMDAICKRTDTLQDVVLNLPARIDALSERLTIWEQWAAKQEKRIDDAMEYVAKRTAGIETARPC